MRSALVASPLQRPHRAWEDIVSVIFVFILLCVMMKNIFDMHEDGEGVNTNPYG
jgi:hypothetical protein